MHVHVVARFEEDAAWPGTVWAHDGTAPYPDERAAAIVAAARAGLALD